MQPDIILYAVITSRVVLWPLRFKLDAALYVDEAVTAFQTASWPA
jgi:hypothetical protein